MVRVKSLTRCSIGFELELQFSGDNNVRSGCKNTYKYKKVLRKLYMNALGRNLIDILCHHLSAGVRDLSSSVSTRRRL